jgi:hypothetical protein
LVIQILIHLRRIVLGFGFGIFILLCGLASPAGGPEEHEGLTNASNPKAALGF